MARTLPEVIDEMLLATTSERQGRAIDRDGTGAMERKKREGLFLMADADPLGVAATPERAHAAALHHLRVGG